MCGGRIMSSPEAAGECVSTQYSYYTLNDSVAIYH